MGKMKIKAAGIPAGRYHVTFEMLEETFHEEWGEGLFWKFQVYEGEFTGKDTGRTTTVDPTPGNACGRMLAGLADKSPAEGVDIDPNDFIGKKYVIDVALSQSGKGTRVERIVRPVDDGKTKTAPSKSDAEDSMDEQAEELF